MEEPVIEFRGVEMAFGSKVVLDHVSFQVKKGETLAVIGPSGTGKSTVLKLLIGLLKPQGGSILIQGHAVEKYTEAQWNQLRQHMGMVFQYSALFDFLDVSENVAFGLRQHTHMAEAQIQERVAGLLEAVGLSGNEHVYPAQLSGGMQKRVGLARALALKPDIILYDEPTAGLDPIMATNISQLILDTKEKTGHYRGAGHPRYGVGFPVCRSDPDAQQGTDRLFRHRGGGKTYPGTPGTGVPAQRYFGGQGARA